MWVCIELNFALAVHLPESGSYFQTMDDSRGTPLTGIGQPHDAFHSQAGQTSGRKTSECPKAVHDVPQ